MRLDDIRAVYPRPHELTHFASVAQEPRPGHAAALYTAISVWLDVTPAFVLNRPAAMALNASNPTKPSSSRRPECARRPRY